MFSEKYLVLMKQLLVRYRYSLVYVQLTIL